MVQKRVIVTKQVFFTYQVCLQVLWVFPLGVLSYGWFVH